MRHGASIGTIAAGLAVLAVVATYAAHAQTLTATVDLVSAGHILRVLENGERRLVVIHGIKCPKTTTVDGRDAKALTTERTAEGEISLEVMEQRGKITYAQVTLPDGDNLAEILLAKGLAEWDERFAEDNARFAELEDAARQQKLGMWSSPVRQELDTPHRLKTPREDGQETVQTHAYRDTDGVLNLQLIGDEPSTARADYLRTQERRELLAEQRAWEQMQYQAFVEQQMAADEARRIAEEEAYLQEQQRWEQEGLSRLKRARNAYMSYEYRQNRE